MNKKKNRKRGENRMAAFLAAMALTAVCLCQAAFAAERASVGAGIDPAQPVSVTIDLEGQDHQAALSIYRAGSWDGSSGAYLLDGDFAAAGIDLAGWDNILAGEMKAALDALENYTKENGIRPLKTGTTEKGRIQFTGLSEGLYFIAQADTGTDNVKVASALVALPMWNEEDGSWDYSGTILPKHEPKDPMTPSDPTEPTTGAPENPGGNNGGNGGGGSGRGDRDRTGPGGDPTTTIGDPDPALANLENITDEDVPLATNPILQAIEDVLVPLGLLPKTADGSVSYTPLLTALVLSGALIILLVAKRRKRAK